MKMPEHTIKTPRSRTELASLGELSNLAKAKLFLGDAPLLASVPTRESGEGFAPREAIEQLGLLVRPFWIDEPDDIEGRAYQIYRQTHPDFDMTMRESVAVRLAEAQHKLPKHWRIIVKAGLRPLGVQIELLEKVQTMLAQKNPAWNAARVLAETRLLVSDPHVKIPPHCTGAAVDVEVLDVQTGILVDMGARANTDGELGWTFSPRINAVQQANRTKLLRAMLAAGLANYAYEWWHFSYGDAYWAVFYDKPAALFGLAKSD